MKKVFLSLVILISTGFLWSQEVKTGIQYGIAFSSMEELRVLDLQIKATIPFSTKIVADFPGYWYYKPMIKLAYKKFSVGIEYTFNSTGSRISGKDYSGEYLLDMRIRRNSPGIFAEYYLHSFKNFGIWISSSGGILFTSLTLKQDLSVINTSLTNNSFSFKAKNYFFQPGAKLVYPWHSFDFEFNAGYLIELGSGALHEEKDSRQLLVNMVSDEPIKPGWNGFILGFTINYTLKKSK